MKNALDGPHQTVLRLLQTVETAVLSRLRQRGGLRPARARLSDSSRLFHRRVAAPRGLGTDRRRLDWTAARLLPQHLPDGGRHLLGAYARHQYRNRAAAAGVRPHPEAIVPVLRQSEDRAPS